jgi:hypothetical protein
MEIYSKVTTKENNQKIKSTIEEDLFKEDRLESKISLRKKKLNEYLLLKRIKNTKITNDNNDDEDIYLDEKLIANSIPILLNEEFDTYEDKITLIHEFLSNNFKSLNGYNYNESEVKKFALLKLSKFSYQGSQELFSEINEEKLKLVFYDIIKLYGKN